LSPSGQLKNFTMISVPYESKKTLMALWATRRHSGCMFAATTRNPGFFAFWCSTAVS
jgi:hypothetical protein